MNTNTNTNDTVATTLRAAADHIEQYGWTQGTYAAPAAPLACCAAGAINYVTTGEISADAGSEMVKVALLEALGRDIPADCTDLDDRVAAWNDFIASDAEAVITALRAAADRAEQQATRIACERVTA
jgi:hypothetical protein